MAKCNLCNDAGFIEIITPGLFGPIAEKRTCRCAEKTYGNDDEEAPGLIDHTPGLPFGTLTNDFQINPII